MVRMCRHYESCKKARQQTGWGVKDHLSVIFVILLKPLIPRVSSILHAPGPQSFGLEVEDLEDVGLFLALSFTVIA